MTTKTTTVTFDKDQLAAIIGTAKDYSKATKQLVAASEKVQGAYTGAILVAMDMGHDDFKAAMESLFDDIRANKGGIAKRVGSEKGDKGGWKIPGSLSTAKSVILSALEFGVDMLDDEDAPRSFGAIRKDVKAETDARKDSERTDAQVLRDDVAEMLKELGAELRKEDVDDVMADHMVALQVLIHGWREEHARLAGDDATAEAEEVAVQAAA